MPSAFHPDATTPSFLTLSPSGTSCTISIGTSDLGSGCMTAGLPNVGLSNFAQCAIDVVKGLYNHGGGNSRMLGLVLIDNGLRGARHMILRESMHTVMLMECV